MNSVPGTLVSFYLFIYLQYKRYHGEHRNADDRTH